jgi:Flp pilus assembly protein TadG
MRSLSIRIRNLVRQFRANDRGSVSVELSVIMPVFLFLTFGAFEVANYQTLEGEIHHTVRTIGRSLSVGDLQAADAQAAVETSLASWGATPTISVNETASEVTLSVSVAVADIAMFSFLDALQSVSASSSLTFRKE